MSIDDNQFPNPLNPEEGGVAVEPPRPVQPQTPIPPTPEPAFVPETNATAQPKIPEAELPVREQFAAPAPLPPVDSATLAARKEFPIKKLLIAFGILGMIIAVVAGTWYAYLNYAGEAARIAALKPKPKDKESCNGCSLMGYEWKWNSQLEECKESKVECNNGKPPTSPPPNQTPGPSGCPSTHAFCGGCVNSCVSFATLAPYGGCRDYVSEQCGTTPTTGTSCSTTRDTTYFEKCTEKDGEGYTYKCPTAGVYFSTTGSCYSRTGGNEDGLCAVYGKYGCVNNPNPSPSGGGSFAGCWTCDGSGCRITAGANDKCKQCYVAKHLCERNTNVGTCTIPNPEIGQSASFDGKCEQTIQIDVACGSSTVDFRSKVYPDCTPKPSASTGTQASLSCTSLTKNVATPTIGSVVTLTCAGAVAPTGATSLSYKFRYNVNGGAWIALTNTTATTARMTPNACGSYVAQCQACGTINGSLVCDPNWVAANAN